MELYQIRYFLAVCETLNFARAAERCRVSSPSLTRAVQKLEREMGGLLIRREGRQSRLTEMGRLLRPMFQEVVNRSDASKTAAQRFVGAADKPVRIGVTASLRPARVVPFLARFPTLHPGIDLDFVEGRAEQLDQKLLDGKLDMALAGRYGPANSRFREDLLYRENTAVVFPPGHWIEQRESVRLSDLKDDDLFLEANSEMLAMVLRECRRQGLELRIVRRCEPEQWIQMLVAAGGGISLLPESAIVHLGTLARPLEEPELQREVSLTTVAGRPYDMHVGQVVRAIRAHRWNEEIPVANGIRNRARAVSRFSEVTA
jgi:DNA-binding transcriptional LysR family regulator